MGREGWAGEVLQRRGLEVFWYVLGGRTLGSGGGFWDNSIAVLFWAVLWALFWAVFWAVLLGGVLGGAFGRSF